MLDAFRANLRDQASTLSSLSCPRRLCQLCGCCAAATCMCSGADFCFIHILEQHNRPTSGTSDGAFTRQRLLWWVGSWRHGRTVYIPTKPPLDFSCIFKSFASLGQDVATCRAHERHSRTKRQKTWATSVCTANVLVFISASATRCECHPLEVLSHTSRLQAASIKLKASNVLFRAFVFSQVLSRPLLRLTVAPQFACAL